MISMIKPCIGDDITGIREAPVLSSHKLRSALFCVGAFLFFKLSFDFNEMESMMMVFIF